MLAYKIIWNVSLLEFKTFCNSLVNQARYQKNPDMYWKGEAVCMYVCDYLFGRSNLKSRKVLET